MEDGKKKREAEKPLTPMQALKKPPKAMQVGPQYHLRKDFCKAERERATKGRNAVVIAVRPNNLKYAKEHG